jgi:hypothetical protein
MSNVWWHIISLTDDQIKEIVSLPEGHHEFEVLPGKPKLQISRHDNIEPHTIINNPGMGYIKLFSDGSSMCEE